MPRRNKGVRLWLRPARKRGKITDRPTYVIKDSGRQISTCCGEDEREEAERKLAEYLAEKYQPERRERALSEIWIADVIKIYLDDVVPGQARPEKAAERAERLLEFLALDGLTKSPDGFAANMRRHARAKANRPRAPEAARGATCKTLWRPSIITTGKVFTVKSCASCCQSAARPASGGSRAMSLPACFGHAGARARYRTALSRANGRCGTYAGFSCLASIPVRDRARSSMQHLIEARAGHGSMSKAAGFIGMRKAPSKPTSASRPSGYLRASWRTCAAGNGSTAAVAMLSPMTASRSRRASRRRSHARASLPGLKRASSPIRCAIHAPRGLSPKAYQLGASPNISARAKR